MEGTTALKPFVHTLDAKPETLRGLRTDVSEWLRASGVDSETARAIVAATHEAAASAITRAAVVRVRGNADRHAVTMVVEGEGEWDSLEEDEDGHRMRLLRGLVMDMAVEHSSGTTSFRLQRCF